MHSTGMHKPNEKIIGQHSKMFESPISAGWDKPRAKTPALFYYMEGHARKCVERYCELANKKTEQLFKVSQSLLGRSPNQKKKNWKIKVNCQKFAPILN